MSVQAQAIPDAAFDTQRVFRAVLDAMSRPGKIVSIETDEKHPAALEPATAAIARCVFDHDTEVWMGDGIAGVDVFDFLKFNSGCPMTKSSMIADFAIACSRSGLPEVSQFKQGSELFPDRSTTLIVQVPDLETGASLRLTGPGIRTENSLSVAGVPDYFWQARREQTEIFPRGVDIVFATGDRIVALPRSTRLGD